MRAILVNYNYCPTWLLTSGLDYLIYDRTDDDSYLKDFPQDRIIRRENIGNVDFDKLSYLIENYDSLPDVFLWGKTNLFKYIEEEEWEKVKDNKTFTPLLSPNHRTYSDDKGEVCFYKDGMYYERNQLIFHSEGVKYFNFYKDFAKEFGLPNPDYLPFPPGGNFILTKETVHKYPKESYEKLASILPYTRLPLEAYFCERAYYTLWR